MRYYCKTVSPGGIGGRYVKGRRRSMIIFRDIDGSGRCTQVQWHLRSARNGQRSAMRDGTAADNAPRSIKLLASRKLIEDEPGMARDCTRLAPLFRSPFISHARLAARNRKKSIKVDRLYVTNPRGRCSIKIHRRKYVKRCISPRAAPRRFTDSRTRGRMQR